MPTLLIDGRPLTEVAGILFYLARRYPEAGLLPADDVEAEAQVVSWMSFIAATVHPARRQGAEHARRIYAIAEQRLGGREWAVGRVLDRRHPPVPAVLAVPRVARSGAGRVPGADRALRPDDGAACGAEDHRDRGCDRLRAAGVAGDQNAAQTGATVVPTDCWWNCAR